MAGAHPDPTQFRSQRWVELVNLDNLVVPPYGAMEVVADYLYEGTTADTPGGLPRIGVRRPTAANLVNVVFNGPIPIRATSSSATGFGIGTFDLPTFALYTSSTPAAGDSYGTQAGSYELLKGNTGFYSLGNIATTSQSGANVMRVGLFPPHGSPAPSVLFFGDSGSRLYFQQYDSSPVPKTVGTSNQLIDSDYATVLPLFRDVYGSESECGITGRFWNTHLYTSPLTEHNFVCTKSGLYEVLVFENAKAETSPGYTPANKNWYIDPDDSGDPLWVDTNERLTDEQLAGADAHQHTYKSNFNADGLLEGKPLRLDVRVREPSGGFNAPPDPCITFYQRMVYNGVQFGSHDWTDANFKYPMFTHHLWVPLEEDQQLAIRFAVDTFSEPQGGVIRISVAAVQFRRVLDGEVSPTIKTAET